jgi:prepilin-type N-terminal cleavage/methylation domain-containing protein
MSKRRAFSLVEILVVVVIMAIIAAVVMPNYLGGGKTKDGKKAPTPMSRAHDTECKSNIGQVRLSIQAYGASDGEERKPASLSELRELPASFHKCPVGNEPYQYDATSGQVKCVHPGHESY